MSTNQSRLHIPNERRLRHHRRAHQPGGRQSSLRLRHRCRREWCTAAAFTRKGAGGDKSFLSRRVWKKPLTQEMRVSEVLGESLKKKKSSPSVRITRGCRRRPRGRSRVSRRRARGPERFRRGMHRRALRGMLREDARVRRAMDADKDEGDGDDDKHGDGGS